MVLPPSFSRSGFQRVGFTRQVDYDDAWTEQQRLERLDKGIIASTDRSFVEEVRKAVS